MSRIVGLDIGQRRIGVAISDETQTIARALGLITAGSIDRVIAEIKDILTRYEAGEVIVGLPLKMDGTEGPAVKKVREFVGLLRKNLSVTVSTFDERLTTKQGEAVLLQADLSRKKRKSKIDSIAAQIILQAYLDFKNRGGPNLV